MSNFVVSMPLVLTQEDVDRLNDIKTRMRSHDLQLPELLAALHV